MVRSPDNGLLTPAMKLARPNIAKAYQKETEVSRREDYCTELTPGKGCVRPMIGLPAVPYNLSPSTHRELP